MDDYTPVKLVFDVAHPMFGADENLCPIIFLHCFNQSKELWHQIPYIIADETQRKAYVYDMRNHGDSQWSATWTCDDMLNDLRHFMNSNKIPKAILIAHSIGGYTAARFAIQSPERVEMLIAEDSFIGTETKEEMDASVPHCLLWADSVRRVPSFMEKTKAITYAVDYMYREIPPEKQESLSKKEHLYKCNYNLKHLNDGRYEIKLNVEVTTDSLKKGLGMKPLEGTYEGPAYFINGGRSLFKVYEKEGEIRKHFPKAEFFLIKDASHNVHIDAPEEFSDYLLKLLLKN